MTQNTLLPGLDDGGRFGVGAGVRIERAVKRTNAIAGSIELNSRDSAASKRIRIIGDF